MKNYIYLTEEESRRLKGMIISAGLDIGTMARQMNVSRPTLSARLNGKIDFSRSEMELFAAILSKNPQSIFFAA